MDTLKRDYLVIHHSLTADGASVSWGAIEDYHRRVEGWRDIGYHYGVELIGDRYFVMVGRPEDEIAAAVKEASMNERGIHVCFVGNYDELAPTAGMLEVAVRRVLRPIMHRHGIAPDHVIGHRDAGLMAGFDWRKDQYKSCPGKAFDLDLLRRLVA